MVKIYKIIKEELNTFLNEKRSVEGIITKDENLGELLSYINDNYGFDIAYVSFRESQHVTKINPNNNFETPTGLYTYKLSDYVDKPMYNIEDFKNKFPYASYREFINIYILDNNKANILNSETSKSQIDGYVKEIQRRYGNIQPIQGLCENWLNDNYESYYSKSRHATHKFWLFIYDVVSYLNGRKKNLFSKLCRELNIHGFDDDNCEGWIHPSEKCQTVFFKSNIFIDTFYIKSNNVDLTDLINKSSDAYNKISDVGIIKMINKNKLNFDKIIQKPNEFNNLLMTDNDKIKKYLQKVLLTLPVDKLVDLLFKHEKPSEIISNIFGDKFKFDHNYYSDPNFMDVLIKHPKILKHVDVSRLDGLVIAEILIEHPNLLDGFKPYLHNLSNKNIELILEYGDDDLKKFFTEYKNKFKS